MNEWQPIETAPKSEYIQLYGATEPDSRMVSYKEPVVFSGYWSDIDGAWCAAGSHWNGPFFNPTHWRHLPEPPNA